MFPFVLLVGALLLSLFASGNAPRRAAADAAAQQVVDPSAQITFPPPIYIVRGQFPIIGTANVGNMTGYFIEFREIAPDLTALEDAIWIPVVPRVARAVLSDELAVWDTTTAPDGTYELRLTVSLSGGSTIQHIVSPLRVENEAPPFVLPPFAGALAGGGAEFVPTAVPQQPQQPPPTTDPNAGQPRVTPTASSVNVRQGDNTAYPVVTALSRGQEAVIIGVSTTGSGWYQIRLSDGRIGWVSPTVVQVLGDVSGVPRVPPPPLPATPTPTNTPIPPTPSSAVNLVAGIVELSPTPPVCQQAFTVGIDVANLGTVTSPAPGTVTLTDTRAADGSVQRTAVGGFPILSPGQTFRVNIPVTIDTWYNETHRITLTIDPGNAIIESNEGDNTRVVEYVLAQGGCS
jgi:hypothetical protein